MKKQISPTLSLQTTNHYPYKTKSKHTSKHRAILGIGGNIGDTKKRFQKLFFYLANHSKISIIQTSPLLQNPAFGYTNQPDFINAVIEIQTNLSPIELLRLTQHTENIFGRKRSFANAPRTLDIDIIFFDDIKHYYHKDLSIPHPWYQSRDSVMIPLKLIKYNTLH